MNNFTFYSPTYFVFGKGEESRAGDMVKRFGGVKPNPRSGLVYEGIELCRKENVDFILAVGGGSP